MNYRHVYHAGNFADVFKHIIVIALARSFLNKETPFCYVETHAGSGCYDLLSKEAQINKEFEQGVEKIMGGNKPPELVKNYLDCIQKLNSNPELISDHELNSLHFYPGSPYFAKQTLRPTDRMVLCELHSEEFGYLKKFFQKEKNINIHLLDGFQGLKALLPPKEKRGFVFIDPSYENSDELNHIVKVLPEALHRWKTGVFALWYPIKNRKASDRFIHSLMAKITSPCLHVELSIYPDDIDQQLNGNGILIINPPWKLEETLKDTIPWLWNQLNINGQGRYNICKKS